MRARQIGEIIREGDLIRYYKSYTNWSLIPIPADLIGLEVLHNDSIYMGIK